MGDSATSTTENLIVDLLEWLAMRDRPYDEVMDAWRTSCPRLPVWEEANDRGLVVIKEERGVRVVTPTAKGLALIDRRRPRAAEASRAV
jgi:hypothetical protein